MASSGLTAVLAAVVLGAGAFLAAAANGRDDAALTGRLAVGVTRERVTELYVLPAAGGLARLISRRGDGATASSPAWAPDRSQIAFESNSGAGSRIDLVEPDGSRLRPLTRPRPRYTVFDGSPAWSKDGRYVLFNRSTVEGETWILTLRRVQPDGGGAKTLWTESRETKGSVMTLSPDGKRILYSHYVDDVSFKDSREALYSVGLDGRGLKRLRRNRDGSRIHLAVWSPDGTRIAFCATPALNAVPAVWVINADGSGARQLSRWRSSCGLAWSPSGNWIAFARHPAGLYAVRPDGSGLRAIARELPVSSVSWSR